MAARLPGRLTTTRMVVPAFSRLRTTVLRESVVRSSETRRRASADSPLRRRKAFLRRRTLVRSSVAALAARADDEVPVPGGPAAVRRLLGLDPTRQPATFFFDLHEILVFATGTHIPWKDVERRKALVDFAEDLARWAAAHLSRH